MNSILHDLPQGQEECTRVQKKRAFRGYCFGKEKEELQMQIP